MNKKLTYTKKNFYKESTEEQINAAFEYCKGYAEYLDGSKTEREAVKYSIALAEANGYKPYSFGMEIKAGDKYYYNNRSRCLFLFRVGSEDINNGIRILASHIDSPRLDFKQMPIYEDGGFCFAKTRYYGGVRKYQWVALPLALHGVIVKKDGSVVDVKIGDDDNDPIFYINDLLPHLAQEQSQKTLATAIPAESLNILLGSRPIADGEDGKAIKMNILTLINEKYGVEEEDFLSADIFVVPAGGARDVGFDRSLMSAYGHDDKVCAYPSLTALFESDDSEHTVMVVLADKEEIGSDGNTGMKSELFTDIMQSICAGLGGNYFAMKANSKCLSADVTACFDPNFSECYDQKNVTRINCGVAMSKYTGHGGKSGTNDAPAEYVAWIRKIMADHGVIWQTGDMGRNDLGGGGTVAKYIAEHNIETVDLGVPVISMHAPYEVVSKVDVYCAHKAFLAFCMA
ncbi:MAG: aminopeptidase [Ruminococcaceae bacterium]|nr:aminopeptidase [Oscillospiraceae bacterium]